ncbi:aminoacyl-tRNA hydrolase [Patescibacteria group bacterium]|nr:aminoacyl-tRNA hydrolase [Patescibacteria group bacterium]
MYTIVGLGNPGEEYENTRHNTGRIVLEFFCKAQKFDDFEKDKKTISLKTEGGVGKEKVICLLPETFMNKSGTSLKKIVTSKKKARLDSRKARQAEKLVVVHDDIDIPLGKWKVSFGKGSAGHKGVESVMRAVKTKDFFRIRVGISPATPGGKIKKPRGDKVLDFLMGKFKPKELDVLKETSKKITTEIEKIILSRSK